MSWTDPAQIAANQEGRVTDEQRQMLGVPTRPTEGRCLVGCLLFWLALLLCLVPGVVLGFWQHLVDESWVNDLGALAGPVVVGGLLLLVLNTWYRKRVALWRALEAGQILHEPGEVVWWQNRYIARTPTRRLALRRRSLALPPPGPYHVYYLAGFDLLLSAQPMHDAARPPATPAPLAGRGLSGDQQAQLALQQALCSTLQFSQDDLACNRRGQLSPAQRAKERRHLWGDLVGNGVLALLFLVGGLGMSTVLFWPVFWDLVVGQQTNLVQAVVATAQAQGSGKSAALFWILELLGLLMLVVAVWGGIELLGIPKKYAPIFASPTPVQTVAGSVQRRSVYVRRRRGWSYHYFYDVGPASFRVTEHAYQALIEGLSYRVFYLPATHELLSIEPLSPPVR
jgi:hypothetical protein